MRWPPSALRRGASVPSALGLLGAGITGSSPPLLELGKPGDDPPRWYFSLLLHDRQGEGMLAYTYHDFKRTHKNIEEAERAPGMCLKAVHRLKLVELEVTSDKAADGLPTRADLQVTPCGGNLKAAHWGRGGVAEDRRGMLRGNQESGKARCRPKNQVAILFKPQLSSAPQLGQGWGQ
eukprot:CAMPEP_0194743556 /NCGR_PEP_ID=MMETSP0296-20130528/99756_1 /TAXON_ID=39354 /ORGANISM="Heterosigma akashiwo, Strain CCMP2393" /LENGTH=177 /DNA_ID=CAMNT_0039655593 /DNA_START=983 /DNA_END=1517 /DNA_ORIENTATION=-